MRRAIISDIHGNLIALRAALEDCRRQRLDDIVCLGDICGYGPDPIECIDLVKQTCKWTLCGNHDAALFMSVAVGFNKYAKAAIDWQRSVLQPHWYSFSRTRQRWNWLAEQPAAKKEETTLYVHASPRDPLYEYVEEADFADIGFGYSQKAIEIFENIEVLSFCGHSHKPGVVTDSFQWIKPAELPGMTFQLNDKQKTLVNIGSIGQPRDNNPDGCYVVLDTTVKTVEFRRIKYDIPTEQKRFQTVPALDEKLWKRLETGT
ncbi:MAG TPA: metallophosphoesterase family protein [Planctomycetota bacterium]|nr:metallophosphoesterase family protein [Planctomycetota bacterium]